MQSNLEPTIVLAGHDIHTTQGHTADSQLQDYLIRRNSQFYYRDVAYIHLNYNNKL